MTLYPVPEQYSQNHNYAKALFYARRERFKEAYDLLIQIQDASTDAVLLVYTYGLLCEVCGRNGKKDMEITYARLQSSLANTAKFTVGIHISATNLRVHMSQIDFRVIYDELQLLIPEGFEVIMTASNITIDAADNINIKAINLPDINNLMYQLGSMFENQSLGNSLLPHFILHLR